MVTPSSIQPDFWKGKKVLITGHTGFKGSWLTLWLEAMGAQVTGFALEPPSSPSLFEKARVGQGVQSIIGDVRDLNAVSEAVRRADAEIVFHMAAQALVRPSYEDPVGTYATNVMGTVHVLDAVRKQGGARVVINVTSDKCYENREWDWGYRENEAMGGYDPYSNSKGCSELVTSSYRRSFFGPGSKTVLASGRAGNVIGGGDWALDRLIPDAARALARKEAVVVRSPHSIRPWQHVLEPLSGYVLLAQELWESGHDFADGWNFGPPYEEAKPVAWVMDRLTQVWGEGARWVLLDPEAAKKQPHEAHFLKLDCSKARARLGWKPRLALAETLVWVADWYRQFQAGADARKLTLDQINRYMEIPLTVLE